MIIELNLATILIPASCAPGASCEWWEDPGAGAPPLFIWGVFLGLIGLAVLVNFLRSRE